MGLPKPCFTVGNLLGGGFKRFLFSPRNLVKIPILTIISYFSNGLKPPILYIVHTLPIPINAVC